MSAFDIGPPRFNYEAPKWTKMPFSNFSFQLQKFVLNSRFLSSVYILDAN